MKHFFTLLSGLLLCLWFGQVLAATQVNVGLNDVIATVEDSFNPKPDPTNPDNPYYMAEPPPISDMTADFFQRTTLAKDQRELRGDGRMSVKFAWNPSPLMYRFEYFRPYNQEIVSDGKTLWIYHPENREVILSDVSFLYNFQFTVPKGSKDKTPYNPERNRAVNFLQGLGRISQDFQINFAPGMYDIAGNYVLELTPRRAMINIRRILLVVNRDTVLTRLSNKTPQRNQTGIPPQFATKAPQSALTSDPFPILSTTVDDQEGNSITMEFSNIRINNRLSQNAFIFIVPAGVQIIKPSEQNQPR